MSGYGAPDTGPYDFAAERYDAERAALRSGRGRESRGPLDEDVPSRQECDE